MASIQSINRSVAYLDQTLGEEDLKWVENMKVNVTEYLKTAADGHFFLRMVETILSRDKNWVRWKIENCPPIEKPAISPKEWTSAMSAVKREATSKKVRLNSAHPLNLDFLKEHDDVDVMEELKDPKRYKVPDIKSFQRGIQEVELDLGFPNDTNKERELKEHKASLSWRALRIASRNKLALLDKIDSYEDISILFEEPKQKDEEVPENGESVENGENGETGEGGENGENGDVMVKEESKKQADIEVVMPEEDTSTPAAPVEQNGAPVEPMVTDD